MCNSGEGGQMGENPQQISLATLFIKYFCSVGRMRGTPLDDGVPMCNSGEGGQMGENPQQISSGTLFIKYFCSVGMSMV